MSGLTNINTTGYTSNLSGQQATNQAQNVTQQNTYTPGQTGLQGTASTAYQNYLNGQVPTAFTEPQSVFDAYNSNFTNNVEPGLVAQYGAGSPQIASQQSLGLQNLAANTYESGLSNYANALGSAGSFGLTPTGTTQSGTGTALSGTTQNQTGEQTVNVLGSLLQQLLGL